MVAAAVIGMAAGVLQLPVAFYLLCKSKRLRPRERYPSLPYDLLRPDKVTVARFAAPRELYAGHGGHGSAASRTPAMKDR